MQTTAIKFPSLSKAEIQNIEKVAQFVSWFLENDPVLKYFIDESAYSIFNEGFRPLGQDPPGKSQEAADDFENLQNWFVEQIFRDLNALVHASSTEFESFIDQLDGISVDALLQAGEIAIRYKILPRNYLRKSEISKICSKDEQDRFKINLLTDRVLEAEVRILAQLFQQFHGKSYCVKT